MKYIFEPIFEGIYRITIFLLAGWFYYFCLFIIMLWTFKLPTYKKYPFYKEKYKYLWELDVLYYTPLDFLLKRDRAYTDRFVNKY